MDIATKLEILADAAKYDVACTSSGVNRSAKKGELGNTIDAGICHSFTADGRCITLLKVLMTNACIYNCAYCVNRAENEVRRAVFKPRELAGAHCTQSTRVCPCWAINANDNRRHTRIRLPNTRPFQRPVPHAFVEARVLQRILARER